MKPEKVLAKLLSGSRNIRFGDFKGLIEAYGFSLSRTAGSHHIFKHSDISELVNVQNVKGQSKPYQIRQFLQLIERYNLSLEDNK